MSAEVAFVRVWRVGRFTATLSASRPRPGKSASCVIEWEPHVPHRLTPAEVAEYRAGRDAAIAEVVRALGIDARVLEA